MVEVLERLVESDFAGQGSASAQQVGRPAVIVRGLTKVFTDFWGRPKARAVDNISFEVRQGEVFGLLGPNGSGKSTTVKLLLGLLYPTKGTIEIYGHSPRHVATKSRIGYLPEESYLYRYLDSEETLNFFGSLFGLDRRELRRRTEQLLQMVGLAKVRRRTVGEFSKGMQRRIGLAQALINDPDLIILDEPTSGLDPIGCREMKDLILALKRRGKAIILSSHLLADVEEVCDRVAILYGGRIQAMGTLNELLTERDQIRITCPVLSRETLEEVLRIIRREVGEGKIKIDNPRQNLESYFLSVVERARTAVETSGAVFGTKIADYLRGSAEEVPKTPDQLLERFVKKQEPKEAAPEPLQASRTIDEEKLQRLVQVGTDQSIRTEQPAQKQEEAKKLKLEEADQKLRALLKSEGKDNAALKDQNIEL